MAHITRIFQVQQVLYLVPYYTQYVSVSCAIRVYARTELRSPETVSRGTDSQEEKMCMRRKIYGLLKISARKILSFFKDGVSVHVPPVSYCKNSDFFFVSFIVSGKPTLRSPTVKRS